MLTFLEVRLQVHGEQWRAGGVVWAPNWPVVTTGLMFSAESPMHRIFSFVSFYILKNNLLNLPSLLACGQFDGERAAQRVHFIHSRFPGHRGGGSCGCSCTVSCGPAAVFTVDEELSDLLGYGDVVYHDCEFSGIHWALVCKEYNHQGKI